MLAAALAGDDPRSIHEWGLMPHMLSMAAGQIRHPVSFVIKMIAHNRLIHDRGTRVPSALPFLKWQFRAFGGRKIDPSLFLVLVETAEKHDLPIKMAKL